MNELENQNQENPSEDVQNVQPEVNTEAELHNVPVIQAEEHEIAEEHTENFSVLGKEELVKQAEAFADADINAFKSKVYSIKDAFDHLFNSEKEAALALHIEQGGTKEDFQFGADTLTERFYAAIKKFNKRKADFLEEQEKKREQNLKDKLGVLNEFKNLIQNEENMQKAFEQFHELQNKWRNTGNVPTAKAQDLWMTYKMYTDKFYELIKINRELQDLDWRKNLEMKIELCERAEELLLEPSLNKSLSSLASLQNKWREVGPIARDKKNEIWERFKAAADKIYARRTEYFNEVKVKHDKNLEEKKAMVEKLQQLLQKPIAKANDWIERGKEVIEIQNEYKKIGFAEKKSNAEVWAKFRGICDKFFHDKNEYFQSLKKEYAANQQAKTDLIMQAENLKESTDWKKTTEEIKQLQSQWKTIGAVGERNSQRLWERFRSACDAFFDRKKQHYGSLESEYNDNLTCKTQLTDEVEQFIPGENGEETIEQLKNFQRRWSEIGPVPFEKKDEIQQRFKKAIDKHFDVVHSKQRELRKSGSYVQRNFAPKAGGEKGAIQHRVSSLQHEVQTLENNLGFFAKSKNSDSLKKEFEEKINKAKEEIKKLKEQLQSINNPI
jgi:hypothetical protein